MSTNSNNEQGALSFYFDGKNAPELVAKGYHKLADLIVEKAKEKGILIHKDEVLFNYLASMDVGHTIAPHMYVIIAELIAFSYVLRGKFPDSWQ